MYNPVYLTSASCLLSFLKTVRGGDSRVAKGMKFCRTCGELGNGFESEAAKAEPNIIRQVKK